MQKKRPRRTGSQPAPAGTVPQTPVGTGRPTHVRTRLIVAVAVVAAAVAGAGAPALLTASQDVGDSQELVTLAARTQDALTLAHSLADERDEVTSYVAAGRPRSKAPSEDRSARVDRQAAELRADTDTPARLRTALAGVDKLRRAALTGKTDALRTHQAYSATITELHRLAEQLAEQLPPRAGSGTHALAELDSAVQQSAAARGLLLAALNTPASTRTVIDPVTGLPTTSAGDDTDRRQRDALTAAAQQARLRADAALAGFRATAPEAAVDSYDSTVTGPEVNSAEKFLAALTDQPTLSDSEPTTSTKKLDAALSARVDLMRGAESALYDHRTKDLEKLRDDDVTALEIRVAVLGVLLLVAVGVATAMARSLTRPLSVLRRGSARLAEAEDPAAQDPIAFTGRNDEFAQVVRSVNALHAHAAALHERVATLETDRKHLVGQRQKMADAREELRAELADSAAQLERLRTSIGSTFVNLALRTLALVERQLAVIEGLEDREQDPDRLATLFKLDHFATVMRRHSENLLVLAGTEHVQQHPGPVPLVDVVRAAVSEIERYERVRIASLPPHAHVAGFAADDLSHLLAELMENATSFSPPELPVEVSGWLLESGEVMLSVQDEGIGVAKERLPRLNARLADFDPRSLHDQNDADGLGLGLYVVARLAHRHGVRVQLREQRQGGTAAVVVLPAQLLAEAPPTALPPTTASGSTTGTYTLPGADAEANSNELRARTKDPLVALAERAVRDTHEQATPPTGPTETRPKPAETPAETTMELLLPTPQEETGEPAQPGQPEEPGQRGEQDQPTARTELPAPTPTTPTTRHTASVDPSAASATRPEFPADPSEASATRPTVPADPSTAPTTRSTAPTDPSTAPATRSTAPTDPSTAPATQSTVPADPSAAPATQSTVPADPSTAPTTRPDVHATRPTAPAAADGEHAPQGPPGADDETRTGAVGGHRDAEGEAEASRPAEAPQADAPDDTTERLTSKGLPKRTPKITAPAAPPRPRNTRIDAEALRRRLGGFRSGAEAGYRDVETEIAEKTAGHRRPAGYAHAEEATGGTAEEASS
ncbi:nitrate- and nitrite sensing domain-containing protein [Streptomyces achromogenes]|uniref:sensor histidine kinase n=1 Tax=Streptomyces achromogenes TaxID=67255 RepID=UPI00367BA0DB